MVQIREFATAIVQNLLDLRGSTMEIKVAWNAIFSKIRKLDSSQINWVELFFPIVQEMTISRYSLKGLRGIIGLYRICFQIYI